LCHNLCKPGEKLLPPEKITPNQENAARNLAAAFILAALFFSGFASLAYEILWQRMLVRLMGAGLPSAIVIFCIFMAGLAAGALLSTLFLKKSKDALPLYAFLEVGIGLIGAVVPFLFEQRFIDAFLLKGTKVIASALVAFTGFAATHHGGHIVRLLASLPFEFPDLSYGLLIFLFLGAMFTATILMGATFNCITKVLSENSWLLGPWFGLRERLPDLDQRFSRKLMYCYFVNLTGAAVGSLYTAFVYIPGMGLTATSFVIVAVNFVVAYCMFRLARELSLLFHPTALPGPDLDAVIDVQSDLYAVIDAEPALDAAIDAEPDLEAPVSPEFAAKSAGAGAVAADSSAVAAVFPLAFCFSLIGMALEVVWTRLLCLVLGSSTYAVGGVLCTNLFGLALGAMIAAWLCRRSLTPFKIIAAASLAAAAYLSATLFLIPRSVWLFLCLQQCLDNAHADFYTTAIASRLAVSLIIVLVPALLLGLVFPCLIGQGLTNRNQAVWTMGKLLACSTIGSICGAVLAGAIIPNSTWVSGIEFCLIALTCVLLGLALVADALSPREDSLPNASASRFLFVGLCAVPLLVVMVRPLWDTTLMSTGASFLEIPRAKLSSFDQFYSAIKGSSSPPLFYREGLSSTVTVETNVGHNVIFLKNNGKVEAALPINWQKPAPTSDARTQVLLGALPVLNCSVAGMDALVIGLGSGITAGTMLQSERIAHLRVCELEPAVLTASHLFDTVNLQPLRNEWLQNKRVEPLSLDGRVSLTRSPQCYDMIVSQPSEPWISGSSDLFTWEFWKLARGRLKPFGVFCQWLQLYCIDRQTLTQLLATFVDVFPATYVFQPAGSGEILLIGYPIPAPFDLFGKKTELAKRLRESKLQTILSDVGIDDVNALQSDLLLNPVQVRELVGSVDKGQFNTDSNLKTEYKLPPELLFNQNNLLENLSFLRGARSSTK
jgi:spermidine synthase